MRILQIRRGFQADHSSSSYLFYAVDHPVNAKGRQIAHRFSSRAEVDEHTVRYLKWGESELSGNAYEALLGQHYDVMASESYDWWTLIIAVPKTPQTDALLAPFQDARGYDDQGVEVEDYGRRLAIRIYCMFDGGGPVFPSGEDPLEELVEQLAVIRAEILKGDLSFLQAVAAFYGAGEEEEDEEEPGAVQGQAALPAWKDMSKAELQEVCAARGLPFRKSWSKGQLREALEAATSPPAKKSLPHGKVPKLSKAARSIVDSLDRP